MPSIPSIKGSVLAGHVDTLRKLVSSEEVSEDELSKRFLPEHLPLLDQQIQLGMWYDIRFYTRVMELLRDVAGNGSNDYLVKCGSTSAERLIQAGFYQQMEYLQRMNPAASSDPRERYNAFCRDLKRLGSILGSLLNFGTFDLIVDPNYPERVLIQIADAAPYPDVLGWTSQGFNCRMAELHGEPNLWRYERPRVDLVWQRMTRTLR
jgi:hypothetical protein